MTPEPKPTVMRDGGGEFDFRKGEVGPLYPVLVDAHGNVIDGLHRLRDDPKWPKKKLEWVKTERDRILVRHIANCARRTVPADERAEELVKIAKELEGEGIKPGAIVTRIAELTPFTDRYVRKLLPAEFRRKYHIPEPESELVPISCDLQNLITDLTAAVETQHSFEAKCAECQIAEKCAKIKGFIEEVLK